MELFRQLSVTAKSNRDSFLGPCAGGGGYIIFTRIEAREIDLGDTLTGAFDLTAGHMIHARNTTKSETVHVAIDEFGATYERAIELLERLGSPTTITRLHHGIDGIVAQSYDIA